MVVRGGCGEGAFLDNRTRWGHVDYGAPVAGAPPRSSYATGHGHHVPPLRESRKFFRPFTGNTRGRFDSRLTYKSEASSAYGDILNARSSGFGTYERARCSSGVHYMRNVDQRMSDWSHGYARQPESETKHGYALRNPMEPPVDPPEMPVHDYNGGRLNHRHYETTNRMHHRHFRDRRSASARSASNEAVTFWTGLEYPKVVGLNEASRTIWMPLKPSIKHAAWGSGKFYSRQMDTTFPRTIAWISEGYLSETKKSYVPPYKGFIKCK